MKFNEANWQNQIDVRDFVTRNITPYNGNERFSLINPDILMSGFMYDLCVWYIGAFLQN